MTSTNQTDLGRDSAYERDPFPDRTGHTMRAESVPIPLTGNTQRDLLTLSDRAAELRAPCTQFPDAWYDPAWSAKAKEFCLNCPLMESCGEFAIITRQNGVWGAMDDSDRAAERRRRSCARKAEQKRIRRAAEKAAFQPVLDDQLLGAA